MTIASAVQSDTVLSLRAASFGYDDRPRGLADDRPRGAHRGGRGRARAPTARASPPSMRGILGLTDQLVSGSSSTLFGVPRRRVPRPHPGRLRPAAAHPLSRRCAPPSDEIVATGRLPPLSPGSPGCLATRPGGSSTRSLDARRPRRPVRAPTCPRSRAASSGRVLIARALASRARRAGDGRADRRRRRRQPSTCWPRCSRASPSRGRDHAHRHPRDGAPSNDVVHPRRRRRCSVGIHLAGSRPQRVSPPATGESSSTSTTPTTTTTTGSAPGDGSAGDDVRTRSTG